MQSLGFIAGFKAGAAGGASGGFLGGFGNELWVNNGNIGSAFGAGGVGAATGGLFGGIGGGLQAGNFAKRSGLDYMYGDKMTGSGSYGVSGVGNQLQDNSCACNVAEMIENKFGGTREEQDFINFAKQHGLLSEKGVPTTEFFRKAGFNVSEFRDFSKVINSGQLGQTASRGQLLVGALNDNHAILMSGWRTYDSGRLATSFIDPARGGRVIYFDTITKLGRAVNFGWLLKP